MEELPVHTGLTRLERRLYHVGDLELPRPVSLVEAAVFLASGALLLLVARLLHLGLDPMWAWTYLLLPWLAAKASTGLVADRKRVHEWALSQVRYLLLEPGLLARLRQVQEPAQARLRASVWQPRRRSRRSVVSSRGLGDPARPAPPGTTPNGRAAGGAR